MADNLSPGITLKEGDFSQSVPSVTSAIGAIVLHAEKGPANVRTLLTNPKDLETIYGRPTDYNYTHWFTAETFLKQSNQLYAVRIENSTKKVAGLTVGLSANGATYNILSTPTTKPTESFPLNYTDIKLNEAKKDYTLPDGSGVGHIDNSSNNLYTQDLYHFYAVGPGTFYENISVMMVNSTDFATLINLKGDLAEVSTTVDINTVCSNYYNGTIGTTGTTGTTGSQYLANSLIKYDLFVPPSDSSSNWFIDRALLNTLTAVEYGPVTSDEAILIVFNEFGAASETYLISNIVDKADPMGNNIFGPKLVNNNSSNIYFFIGNDETSAAGIPMVSIRKTYLGNADLLTGEQVGTSLSDLTGEIETAWQNYFTNPEEIEVDILIDPDYPDVIKRYMDQIAKEIRKDCIAILSVPLEYMLNPTNKRPISAPFTTMRDYVSNILNINSNYSAIYGNYFKIYDRFAEKERWVPAAGFAAATIAYTDFTDAQWYAPAGINRGIVSNVIDIAVNPNKAQRDVLYYARINPIVKFQGEGIVIWGQKTLQSTASSFDRINVRRLFIYIEKAIAKMARAYLFEFNDDFTRTRVRGTINPFLSDIKARRGVYDYLVVCDETNNTPQIIDTNQFVIDVYVKATRVAEFIQLNAISVGTGVEFNQIVAQRQ